MSGHRAQTLRSLQQWFAKIVTSRAPAVARETTRRIAAGTHLDRVAQCGIYRFAYLERLCSVMANDYPAVQQLVGDAQFRDLVGAYVRAHPSRHPNLNQLGAKFPRFLARRRSVPRGAFTAELAALELAIAQATEAEQLPALDLSSLAHRDARQRANLRLSLQPSVRLLSARYPIAAWHVAWAAGEPPPPPRPSPSWTCVHRIGFRVRVTPLGSEQFAVMRAMAGAAPLAAAVRRAGPEAPVHAWFAEWAAAGLFVDPTASPAPERRSPPRTPPVNSPARR